MESIELKTFVEDFSLALKRADSKSPKAVNVRSKEAFQPGIGPHSEAQTVLLVTEELKEIFPDRYADRINLGVPYPEYPRLKCDLCIGHLDSWDWGVEIKMLRFLGDNGKVNDNILMHILSPYPEHRSALTDCIKLKQSTLGRSKAVLIYGYDSDHWPLEPAIDAFETLARSRVRLGVREAAAFGGLIHPVHNKGQIFAWELLEDLNQR
jgi:hypothetical protein